MRTRDLHRPERARTFHRYRRRRRRRQQNTLSAAGAAHAGAYPRWLACRLARLFPLINKSIHYLAECSGRIAGDHLYIADAGAR